MKLSVWVERIGLVHCEIGPAPPFLFRHAGFRFANWDIYAHWRDWMSEWAQAYRKARHIPWDGQKP
jgi:hypothetical protein